MQPEFLPEFTELRPLLLQADRCLHPGGAHILHRQFELAEVEIGGAQHLQPLQIVFLEGHEGHGMDREQGVGLVVFVQAQRRGKDPGVDLSVGSPFLRDVYRLPCFQCEIDQRMSGVERREVLPQRGCQSPAQSLGALLAHEDARLDEPAGLAEQLQEGARIRHGSRRGQASRRVGNWLHLPVALEGEGAAQVEQGVAQGHGPVGEFLLQRG
ncbi:hypothetical protein GALL_476030 [mine drainage metagenome]|uniref:Uncharacterized protein n=1 Tax=mine drainage metagenome TaxID=410659 RepID=A0A1J5PJ08_9ZZZZ